MYSNIVVGTDGSETAAKAVELAVSLARLHGATLHLVTASKQPTGVAGGPLAGGEPISEESFSLLGEDEMLAEIAAGIEGVEVRMHAATGNPAAAIVRVAEEVAAELIVVGSKGMTGTRRVLGSVPNSVAHSANCDVLIAKTA
jgi:nucleotide-binding universal stress UspA family protein